ncbi:hypothetical protein [Kitasatospora cineracea]|uniref:hypothetical protein n=1 Tax=Kitasatospora cineracea TaxID=88074 RepID=UPI0036CEA3F9
MDIPPDLIDLQRARIVAEEARAAHVLEVETRRREQHPDDVVARRMWSAEEQAEDERLQAAVIAALDAVRTHPALAGGPDRHKLEQAALKAARELAAAG